MDFRSASSCAVAEASHDAASTGPEILRQGTIPRPLPLPGTPHRSSTGAPHVTRGVEAPKKRPQTSLGLPACEPLREESFYAFPFHSPSWVPRSMWTTTTPV